MRNIMDTGSISKAAKMMGMSYKAAWDDIDAMNKLADAPLVVRVAGGKEGGGTKLTEAGVNTLRYFDSLQLVLEQFMWASHFMMDGGLSVDGMKNCFRGKIESAAKKDGYIEVITSGAGGMKLVSFLPEDAMPDVENMKDGLLIRILPKRLFLISPEHVKGVGMRNIFAGEINSIRKRQGYVEVVLDMGAAGEITADVSSEIFPGLNASIGAQFCAACQEFDVLLLFCHSDV